MNTNKNSKLKFRGLFVFNKYTFVLLFIYFLLAVGVSYAYYAYQYENTTTIVGNVVAIDADLDVELVVGTTTKMVPMMNDALSNAINGVGGTSACIDANGNLSCQVYKITLTNNGSRLRHVTGTVELYAKDGTNNTYTNLSWRELRNTTTVQEAAVVNGMSKSTLVSDITMESKEIRIWYIAVWISEIDADQTNSDKGQFGGTVTFESTEAPTNVFTETIMAPNAESDADIDFSVPSSTSGTNGIYLRSGTENDDYPIYYYRGNVNNNLIFAETCWKVVRTTETGGLKLIYNGVPTNGQCNNTGDSSRIGTKSFNTNYNSPAYAGYMYSSPYTVDVKDMSSVTDAYVYGNYVTYSNGTYTLMGTEEKPNISSADWSTLYADGLKNNHYTCFSTSTTCETVYYIHNTASTIAFYMPLTGGKTIETALTEMLGADDENTDNYNTTSSTIKGDKNTEGTLDYWYYNNIFQKGYSNYIEDTVYCNDRSISQLGGFDPDGGLTNLEENEGMGALLVFSEFGSIFDFFMGNSTTLVPSLTCSRNIDKFTVSQYEGNGDSTYPVGLLTNSEVLLAGGSLEANNSYYLYTGSFYWGGSPIGFSGDYAYASSVYSDGNANNYIVDYGGGVRPSVSLRPGFSLTGDGDGSVINPYIVG